jgi:hypothetical protein
MVPEGMKNVELPIAGNFEIGPILHLKSEIRNIELDAILHGPICDFGFRI